LRLAKQSQF